MVLEQEATETVQHVHIFFTISLYSHHVTFSDLDAEGYRDSDCGPIAIDISRSTFATDWF